MDQSNMKLSIEDLKSKVEDHDHKLDQVFRYLQKFHNQNPTERKKVGFKQ